MKLWWDAEPSRQAHVKYCVLFKKLCFQRAGDSHEMQLSLSANMLCYKTYYICNSKAFTGLRVTCERKWHWNVHLTFSKTSLAPGSKPVPGRVFEFRFCKKMCIIFFRYSAIVITLLDIYHGFWTCTMEYLVNKCMHACTWFSFSTMLNNVILW